MTSETAPAPFALIAGEVDFADRAPAHQGRRVRFDYFAHEFMTRRAGKAVIPALKFEVGIADAATKQANQCEAGGPAGQRLVPYFYPPVFQVHGKHAG
jgi:hypothetical protein